MKKGEKIHDCIKRVRPSKILGEKSCEIKGGGHEIAAMVHTKNKLVQGKKIPPTPGFELQVTQCLVGTVFLQEGWIFFLKPKVFIVSTLQ